MCSEKPYPNERDESPNYVQICTNIGGESREDIYINIPNKQSQQKPQETSFRT